MKRYKYRARKSPTEVIDGVLDANSQDEAVEKINRLGMMPVDVDEVILDRKSVSSDKKKKNPAQSKKIPQHLLTHAYRQFARFVRSGVPILMSLKLIAEETNHPVFRGVISEMESSVRQGQSLSSAMINFPKVFNPFEIALVQAGEGAGQVQDALEHIANYREKQEELHTKVRAALIYPAFVMLVGLATVVIMLGAVVPKFASFFADLGQSLPLPTRILMFISTSIQAYGGWMAVLGAIVALIAFRTWTSESTQRSKDQFLLKVPKVGKILKMSETARFSRSMALLISSGIPLVHALKFSIPVVKNKSMRFLLLPCAKQVEQGNRLSQALANTGVLPSAATQMIRLGEESGKLDEAFLDLADWYEKETENSIRWMTQLLEPVLILVIGSLLGLIIMAILLPIFSLNAVVV